MMSGMSCCDAAARLPLARWVVSDDVQPCQAGVHVQPRDAEGMVMEPDGARLLLGRVDVGCPIGPAARVSLSP